MQFLVFLRAGSDAASMYADNNDGIQRAGVNGELPILHCTDVQHDLPNYLFLVREFQSPTTKELSHQTLYVPHGDVSLILRFAEDPPKGFGFV